MKKQKSGFLRSMSYMTASVGLFILSLGLTVFLIVRAVLTEGAISRTEGILGTVALIASAAVFIIPLYGHFIVRMDGKADWRVGAALNGIMMLLLIFLYFLGIS